MAASTTPSGNKDGSSFQGGGLVGNPSNGNSAAAVDSSGAAQALKHNPGLAVDWTPEEQSILEEGLTKYASEAIIVRYAKIAMQLHEKTVRDVALRCRWMTKRESGKKRKDEHSLTRKSKDKKGVPDPSAKSSAHLAARPSVPLYTLPVLPIDNDDEISHEAIGGATGQLLEQNNQVFSQISANLASFQIQENINLFCRTWNNILTILNDMNDMPGVMKQMPPLPVKVNEELANSILPNFSQNSMSQMQS